MTASYRPCDPAPSDEAEVRKFLTIVSDQAQRVCGDRGGLLQISRVHPADDKLCVVGRYKLDDVPHMVEDAIGAADAGHNVYIELRVLRPDTPRGNSRGDASYTVAVLALVRDNDADKGKTSKAGPPASMRVETSPGNAHDYYFASEPLSVEVAKEIGQGMRAAGGDHDTGNLTQPYRIAGTSNYPNRAKQERGRFEVHPTRIIEHSGVTHSADELRAAYPAPKKEQRTAGTSGTNGTNGEGVDWQEAVKDFPEDLRTLIEKGAQPGEDRSARFHSAVGQLKRRYWNADNILAYFDKYPKGIAEKYDGRMRKEVDRSFERTDGPPDGTAFGPIVDMDEQAGGEAGDAPPALSVIRIKQGALDKLATAGEWALIAAGVPFYAHAGELQKPIVDEVEATRGRKAAIARLSTVTPDMLRDHLSRSAQWERYNERKKCFVPADPPRDVAAIILSREGEWRFPPAVGVITTPTLRPDGTILSQPGYDPATRLILMNPPAMPAIPEAPSRDHAATALQMLDDLVSRISVRGPSQPSGRIVGTDHAGGPRRHDGRAVARQPSPYTGQRQVVSSRHCFGHQQRPTLPSNFGRGR